MNNRQIGGWQLYIDDKAFPDYLLVRATGTLDDAFYVRLFTDLKAYMAATVGVGARFAPIIFDARECYPSRNGLSTLHQLVRRKDCHLGPLFLWISQHGPNSSFLHAVALMLRALLGNIHIVSHIDEAYGLLGVPLPAQEPLQQSLHSRFARWAS